MQAFDFDLAGHGKNPLLIQIRFPLEEAPRTFTPEDEKARNLPLEQKSIPKRSWKVGDRCELKNPSFYQRKPKVADVEVGDRVEVLRSAISRGFGIVTSIKGNKALIDWDLQNKPSEVPLKYCVKKRALLIQSMNDA